MATIYKYSYVQNVSDIWNYLGTFWAEFADKAVIEKLWFEMMEAARRLQKDLYVISLSKTLSTCPSIITSEYDYLNVIYSGNTTAFLYSGYYYMNLPEYTITISGLHLISYSGAYTYISGNNFYSYSTELLPGTDYSFDSTTEYRLKLLTPVPEKSIIMISGSQKINPLLFKAYGSLIGYDFETWKEKNYVPPINYVGTGLSSMVLIDYESDYWMGVYSKYFIWAMTHYSRVMPTINNIKDGISVAAGIPFVWYSGIVVDKTATTVIIDHGSQFDYRYLQYFRDSSWPNWRSEVVLNSGISQFQVLLSGVAVYDNFNSSGIAYMRNLLPMTYQQNSKFAIEFDNNILIDK